MEYTTGILKNENDIRPNRYASRAMILVAAVVAAFGLLNEFGIVVLIKTNIRICVLVTAVCAVLVRRLGNDEDKASNPATKYIIMSAILAAMFVLITSLDQYAVVALFFPFLLAAQYHSRKITQLTIISACATALLSSPLACLLGLWSEHYITFQLHMMGLDVAVTRAADQWDTWFCVMEVLKYIGIPRLIITMVLSTVLYSITKTELASLSVRMKETSLSRIDALTGVYSRHSYEEMLEKLSCGNPDGLICIYADVNGLHLKNNTEGHDSGDDLLKNCANILREVFGNRVFRTGGDEFVVMSLERFNTKERIARTEQLLKDNGISMSIGSSVYEPGESISDTLRRAEQAMYASKRAYYSNPANERRRRREGETNADTVPQETKP